MCHTHNLIYIFFALLEILKSEREKVCCSHGGGQMKWIGKLHDFNIFYAFSIIVGVVCCREKKTIFFIIFQYTN